MYDTTWKNKQQFGLEPRIDFRQSQVDTDRIEKVGIVQWEEHCLECAPPQCYSTCLKYVQRIDRKCVRMSYGMVENPAASGLFDYGVDCRFSPWAKIECRFSAASCSVRRIRKLDKRSRFASRCVLGLSKLFKPVLPKLSFTGALNVYRNKWLTAKGNSRPPDYDAFLLECYSDYPETFRLNIQCDKDERIFYRDSVEIVPGHNYHEIEFRQFGFPESSQDARVFLFPENDINCRLIFTWLDFVKFAAPEPGSASQTPAEKVKCIAWDLDNTMWNGVLIESEAGDLQLNQEVVDTIRRLDERGILHTICSKNSFDDAWPVLEQLGIAEYFIYPAINWGAKSENLLQLAKRINIGIDTFAFVDDSPHERAEVSSRLPMVRVYHETEAADLAGKPEFDIPVTEMSRKRRQSYLGQMKRDEFQAQFGDDYLKFLSSLELQMRIFTPAKDTDIQRCFELVQRTNQLNLSALRYSAEEFDQLLKRDDVLCIAFSCEDRFGNYGTVGFASIVMSDQTATLKDLVISCRIAQRRYEHALIHWITTDLTSRGIQQLQANLIKTGKNHALASVFEDLPFGKDETDSKTRYTLSDFSLLKDEKIVSITATAGSSATP